MANTIKIKRSSTATAVPTAGQLVEGELAINTTDKRLFSKTAGGVVFEITDHDALTNFVANEHIDWTSTSSNLSTTGTVTALRLQSNEWRGNPGTANQLIANAGESYAYATGQTGEFLYVNAESGLQINSSPDNWTTGWAGRNTATICDTSGNSSLPGTLNVTGAISGPNVTSGSDPGHTHTAYSLTTHNHDHGSLTGLSDDDHSAVYPGYAQTETISGTWTHTGTHFTNNRPYKDNTPYTGLGNARTYEIAFPFSPYIENKFQWVLPTTAEYSTNNGGAWSPTGWTTDQLNDLMMGRYRGQSLTIDRTWTDLRLVWDYASGAGAQSGYVYLNYFYLYYSTSGNQMSFQIEEQDNDTSVWADVVAESSDYGTWPGHTSIPHSTIPFLNSSGRNKAVRVTFRPNWIHATNSIYIYNLNWYGEYPAAQHSKLFYWDRDKYFYTVDRFYPNNQTTNYVDSTRIANWQTAYGWGNHASAGYLTSLGWATSDTFTGTYPIVWKSADPLPYTCSWLNVNGTTDTLHSVNFAASGNITGGNVTSGSDPGHTHTAYSTTGHTHSTLTFNNSGSGGASGSTYNGGSTLTVSYNTIGAASSGHNHSGTYQPLDGDLTAIAGLAGTSGLARKTAADTWTLDTATYLTGNQTITLSGDVTGSGTTAITTTVGNDSHTHSNTMVTIGDLAAETARSVHATGIYTYNSNNQSLGGSTPVSYWSVLGWGQGTGGMGQLAANWTSSGLELWYRSLRDTIDNWWDWKEIYHSGNVSTIESALNHDNLTGFVANEHIDWTSASANLSTSGTIAGSNLSGTNTGDNPGVTSVAAGNGMSFTTITGTGSVVMGTPGTLTASTSNGVTATSHTHAITTSGTGTIMASSGATLSGAFNCADNDVNRPTLEDYGVKHQTLTITANAATFNCTLGNSGYMDLQNATGTVTMTFSNPSPSGTYCEFVLHVQQGSTARSITWPAAVDWRGTTPSLSTTDNDIDIFHFCTYNGGTNWYGSFSVETGGLSANQILVTTSTTASAYKVPFANTTASTTGQYGLLQDSTATFTYNPSTNTLTVGVVNATSDERLKENISEYIAVPLGFKAKQYDMGPLKGKVGYVAQDVLESLPAAVTSDENGMLSLDYNMVLVAKIAELEARLAKLEQSGG